MKFSSVQNPHAEARGFDQDYRLTGITDTGTSTLQSLNYAYYPTNNVQTITDAVNPGNTQNFSYDNLQRLTQAAGGYGSFGFTYDKDGNRLTQTLGGVTTNYGYGTANDLLATLSVGGMQTQAIGYTADGRMASFSPGIQAPGGQYITSLSYNQDAQLSAVNATGGALASYTYDAFGQRLIKTISGTNGEIYQYGRDGMLLEETNSSGIAQADYIYLDSRPIATLDPTTGSLYFLSDDMLGTPQLATDSSQAVAWQASYQPFGMASVSGTLTQNLRFPGQYFDVESGWNHNGFRDYISDLGRYAEPDPLGSGNNLYVYVGDNPTNLIDPLGLCPTNSCASALSAAKRDAAGVARAKAAWDVLQAAANAHNIPTSLLAAIGVQETDFRDVQEVLPGGGPGPGMGVFQLTNQQGVSAAQAFNLPFAANYAANMLSSNMNYFSNAFSFTPDQLLLETAASYNLGKYGISGNPNTIDKGSNPNGRYGHNVLGIMNCF